MHFGREGRAAERAKEADLLRCLDAHAGEAEALYLLGDVFDEYVEYGRLIPKGFVRFQARLAAWTDRGVPVTYFAGNHDPWHQNYFARELGVRFVPEAALEPLYGAGVYMTHGDALRMSSRLQAWLRPLLRHPLPVGLYRAVLPADAGLGLARWVNRTFHKDRINPVLVAGLRDAARRTLEHTAARAVVLAHSHQAELCQWPSGCYLNTGAWHAQRTFGRLDAAGWHLLRWSGAAAVSLDDAPWP